MSTITVYSKPRCVQCDATHRQLDRLGIPYVSVDVTTDLPARDRIMALGYSSAPVVIAGQEHWCGYRPDRIANLRS